MKSSAPSPAPLVLVALAMATAHCTQVQRFSRGDGAGSNDAFEYDVIDDFPPAVCNATGFVSGPLELSTGTDNSNPLVDRSGPDLVVAWLTTSSVRVRFVDPVTLAPRGGAIDATHSGALAAIAGTGRGVTLALSITDGSTTGPALLFVGRDGTTSMQTIALGAAATGTDEASALVATSHGYGLTIRTRTALLLARLTVDGQLADANAITHIADVTDTADIRKSAVAWNPGSSRYVIAYPRGTSRLLMSARVSESGALEASDTRVIDDAIVPEHHPALRANGSGFGLLSCLDGIPNGSCDPAFALLSPDGITIRSAQGLGGEIAGNVDDSSLAFGGGTYGVLWSGLAQPGEPYNQNIHFVTIDASGAEQGAPAALRIDVDNAINPSIVWDGNAFAAAWGTYEIPTNAQRVYVARLCNP